MITFFFVELTRRKRFRAGFYWQRFTLHSDHRRPAQLLFDSREWRKNPSANTESLNRKCDEQKNNEEASISLQSWPPQQPALNANFFSSPVEHKLPEYCRNNHHKYVFTVTLNGNWFDKKKRKKIFSRCESRRVMEGARRRIFSISRLNWVRSFDRTDLYGGDCWDDQIMWQYCSNFKIMIEEKNII